jgi:hypothetical protein
MSPCIADRRRLGEKGTYAIFWNDAEENFSPVVFVEIYSSLYEAMISVEEFPDVPQSLHDTSGRLIAYTDDGKVVMCSA